MLERLDETKADDLAAFTAGGARSLARVAVGLIVFIAWLFVMPVLLGRLWPPLGLLGFPLGMLVAFGALATTSRGRGALWTFGRGRSPSQSVRNLVVVTGLVGLVCVAMAVHG